MNLESLDLFSAAELIRAKEISPVELVRGYLERIERLDPVLNAFITLLAESALEEARRAEAEILQGGWRGPLHGIPLALKDLYETREVRTTAGSRVFQEHVPKRDAAVVVKLRQAGAVLLGKLNMHEIALGVTNVNPHFGSCCNPWDPQRMTGGSSGGSAAALAAGLCLGSLGSDTGGSIRIPSSLCGVVGLKPTYGRVSLRGMIPLSWNLDHAGPMARTVRDAALLLQEIAGYDAEDPASVDLPVDDYAGSLETDVRGWRIAMASGEFFEMVDEEVDRRVKEAARGFEALGAVVEEVEFPEARQAAQGNGFMVVADAAAFHQERLKSCPQDFGADVRQRLESGAASTVQDYIRTRKLQAELRRKFELFFETYDLLLTPATPVPAPLREGDDAVRRAPQLTRFTAPFNFTGLPAISIPCGFSSQGLPVGLQMVSGPWQEAKVLQAAYQLEKNVIDSKMQGRRPQVI